MKRADLQKCLVCGLGVMRAGSPVFYRVTLESLIVDPHAVQRAHGLEHFFGGGKSGTALGNIMGPDEDLAKTLTKHPPATICLACATTESGGVARIDELCHERATIDEARKAEKAAEQTPTMREDVGP